MRFAIRKTVKHHKSAQHTIMIQQYNCNRVQPWTTTKKNRQFYGVSLFSRRRFITDGNKQQMRQLSHRPNEIIIQVKTNDTPFFVCLLSLDSISFCFCFSYKNKIHLYNFNSASWCFCCTRTTVFVCMCECVYYNFTTYSHIPWKSTEKKRDNKIKNQTITINLIKIRMCLKFVFSKMILREKHTHIHTHTLSDGIDEESGNLRREC